jgi:hypothetical protein
MNHLGAYRHRDPYRLPARLAASVSCSARWPGRVTIVSLVFPILAKCNASDLSGRDRPSRTFANANN